MQRNAEPANAETTVRDERGEPLVPDRRVSRVLRAPVLVCLLAAIPAPFLVETSAGAHLAARVGLIVPLLTPLVHVAASRGRVAPWRRETRRHELALTPIRAEDFHDRIFRGLGASFRTNLLASAALLAWTAVCLESVEPRLIAWGERYPEPRSFSYARLGCTIMALAWGLGFLGQWSAALGALGGRAEAGSIRFWLIAGLACIWGAWSWSDEAWLRANWSHSNVATANASFALGVGAIPLAFALHVLGRASRAECMHRFPAFLLPDGPPPRRGSGRV